MRARGSRSLAGSSSTSTFGIMQQDARDLQALLHALAQLGDQPVLQFAELGQLDHGVDDRTIRDGVGGREEFQEFADRDALVDARVVGHVADQAAYPLWLERDVDAVDFDAAPRAARAASP